MFDLELFNKFYEYGDGENTVVEKSVIDAYYLFIRKFCIHSSYIWKQYLKDIEKKENGKYRGNLTVSDETLTWWTILTKNERIKEEANFIKQHGKDAWESTRSKRKSGPHESKDQLDLFTKIYNKIEEIRKDGIRLKFWEKLFFNNMFPPAPEFNPIGYEISVNPQKQKFQLKIEQEVTDVTEI